MRELRPYIQGPNVRAITKTLAAPAVSLGLTARHLGELWLTIALSIMARFTSKGAAIWLTVCATSVLAIERAGTKQPVFETGRQVRAPPQKRLGTPRLD